MIRATQYDEEMLQFVWGTKEVEMRYTHILSEARQREEFTIIPVYTLAWQRSWHQPSSPERYRIRTLMLMILWKERIGVLVDIQGGLQGGTGQRLVQLPIRPQCAIKRAPEEGEEWQCLQVPGQGPYKVRTTWGPTTGTLALDGCVHNIPVLTLWEGKLAHTDYDTRNLSQ